MSKIGKKLIEIPEEVQVNQSNGKIQIKGPLGENSFIVPQKIKIEKKDNQIIVEVENLNKFTRALWGTSRALLANKIFGVSKGFQRDLILEGLGYVAEVQEDKLSFKLGYNHPVFIDIDKSIKVEVKPQRGFYLISVKGIDKEAVGQFAGKIRKLKRAEPYKGKGFRYSDEKIKRKAVKKLGK